VFVPARDRGCFVKKSDLQVLPQCIYCLLLSFNCQREASILFRSGDSVATGHGGGDGMVRSVAHFYVTPAAARAYKCAPAVLLVSISEVGLASIAGLSLARASRQTASNRSPLRGSPSLSVAGTKCL